MKPAITPIEGDQIPLFELPQDEPEQPPPPRPKPTGKIIVRLPMRVGQGKSDRPLR